MKTKITNINSICTWSPDENKVIYLNNVELLIDDSRIIRIDKTVENAKSIVGCSSSTGPLWPPRSLNIIKERQILSI